MGRFLQTDPIGYEDQYNLYAYVGNDPVNLIDPTGMQSCDKKRAGCPRGGERDEGVSGLPDQPDCLGRADECSQVSKQDENGYDNSLGGYDNSLVCRGRIGKACKTGIGIIIRKIIPKPKSPKLRKGVTNSQFGKAAGFGKSLKDLPVYTRAQNLKQVKNLKNLGFTKTDITKWRNFYSTTYTRSFGKETRNLSALHRSRQLNDLWWAWTLGI